MDADRIDFISSYCDRWCERCAFTDRCSAFACELAIGMCGDFAQGVELAVGRPKSPDVGEDETVGERMMVEFANNAPSADEIAAFDRQEKARDARLDASPLVRMSKVYMRRSTQWVDERGMLESHPDPVVREAFAVVCRDAFFIGVKLHRALDGRDRRQHDEEDIDDDPIQNDWNGSAKVALISIERSAAAWRAIGGATNDASASVFADALDHLRGAVLDVFPDAMLFKRPGFDENPGESGAR